MCLMCQKHIRHIGIFCPRVTSEAIGIYSNHSCYKQMYNAALAKRTLAESLKLTIGKTGSNSNICSKCGGIGHKKMNCPRVQDLGRKIQASSVNTGIQDNSNTQTRQAFSVPGSLTLDLRQMWRVFRWIECMPRNLLQAHTRIYVTIHTCQRSLC